MIAIVDSGGANIESLKVAFAKLHVETILTTDVEIIQQASHVILPGVGTANRVMNNLQQLDLIPTLRSLTQPVLGICVGMQILFQESEEENTQGLSIISGSVSKLQTNQPLPHMGWNTLNNTTHWLKTLPADSMVYFVHQFAAEISSATCATSNYDLPFAAAVQHNNFCGVQFHPELSSKTGQQILKLFLELGS